MTHDYNDSRMVYTRRSHDPQMTLVSLQVTWPTINNTRIPAGHMTHN